MLNNLNKKEEASGFSPVKPEPVAITDSTVSEEIVIYDECGDTLWDRVLRQEDNISNLVQDKDSNPD